MITHKVEVDGHKLVAICHNPEAQGQPIILIHGITGSPDAWPLQQMDLFTAHGPCYVITLPGHYPATFPPNLSEADITADMVAQTLAKGIQQLVGTQPITVIGHSTGGFSTLALAATMPDQVERAISVAGFAIGTWTGLLGLMQWWADKGAVGKAIFRFSYALNRAIPQVQKQTWVAYAANRRQFFAYPHFDTYHAQVNRNFQRLDLHNMANYFSAMLHMDITDWLPRIKVPLLLITGEEDPIVPSSESKRIAKIVPQAELAVIQNCGHLPFIEKHEEYGQQITNWLSR